MTSKLQVTIPKALADQYRIKPGDEIEWQAAGDTIRLVPARARRTRASSEERLAQFRAATKRAEESQRGYKFEPTTDRGWTREDLYER